jgi:hypothetical protein
MRAKPVRKDAQYSSDNTRILLCGSICDEVRNDATGRIDGVLGCTTVVK